MINKFKFNRRKFLADTFSMISFSFVIEGARELAIGMTPVQTLYSRLAGIPIDLFIGRPYGVYLDWLRRKFHVGGQSSFIKKSAVDISAFVSAMMPIYAGVLYVLRVEPGTIVAACGSAALFQVVYGRPYGIYLDTIRKLFKTIKDEI